MVSGAVETPGKHRLALEARLLSIALAAGVKPDAYLIGATWFNTASRPAQEKLKLGLLYELDALIRDDRLNKRTARYDLARRIKETVESMPVTGRRPVSLDPIRLESERKNNRLLSLGDQLHYPLRPMRILVTGAVQQDCALDFIGLKAASDYVENCPRHASADQDWIYIIQPDGTILYHPIASWNAAPKEFLAPGARLLVPLRSDSQNNLSALNEDLARFYATQPIFGDPLTP